MMGTIRSFETSVLIRVTLRHIAEDGNYFWCHEKNKALIANNSGLVIRRRCVGERTASVV
jgi:hypothetical protein